MNSTNTRCIVLRTIKYGDNSIIADLLTREWGRLSVAVKVGAGGNGRRRRLMFQPLNILESWPKDADRWDCPKHGPPE